ncbi:MAG TPA: FecR family protein [bacterium]|jgi:hypothetical protein|nr:FecR family protein [bacterium]
MIRKSVTGLSLLIVWLILGLVPLCAQTNPVPADPVEYVVEDIKGGNVQVLEENSKTWDNAQEGQTLESGDEIRVGDNSEATLTMQSDTQVHLSADSDLKVGQIEPNETNGFLSHLVILAGTILSDVKKNLLESHSSFEVEANGVVCGVRGTAFEVSNVNGEVQTVTHEGKVEAVSGGESHYITAGSASAFRNGRYQGIRQIRPEELNRFKQWRSVRARIRAKRLQRVRAIRMGRRQAWVRRHSPSKQRAKRKEEIRRRYDRRNHE